jgi:hypothetical protein
MKWWFHNLLYLLLFHIWHSDTKKCDNVFSRFAPSELTLLAPTWYLIIFLLHEDNSLPAILSISYFTGSYGIAAIAPFSHRLAFGDLPADIQRLRCKVNFQALVFLPHITSLGESLVKRLRSPIKEQSNELIHQVVEESTNHAGKYAVLHLRFDKVNWGIALDVVFEVLHTSGKFFLEHFNWCILFRIWLHILPVTLEVGELNN